VHRSKTNGGFISIINHMVSDLFFAVKSVEDRLLWRQQAIKKAPASVRRRLMQAD
jgi:hypothetical protein